MTAVVKEHLAKKDGAALQANQLPRVDNSEDEPQGLLKSLGIFVSVGVFDGVFRSMIPYYSIATAVISIINLVSIVVSDEKNRCQKSDFVFMASMFFLLSAISNAAENITSEKPFNL